MLNQIIKLGFSTLEAKELIKVSKNISEDYSKLLEGYPIQYLIGYVNFYGNKIYVDNRVLIPRYETELLVDKVINKINKKSNIKLLDLCCGSGAIGISISKYYNIHCDYSDISSDALEVCKKNIKENKVRATIYNNDLLNNNTNKYNLIVCNPPYVSYNEDVMDSVYKYEPHLALFADNNGLSIYERILSTINKNLEDEFLIAFEIGCTQKEQIINLALKYLNNINIICEKDYSNRDRFIFISSK